MKEKKSKLDNNELQFFYDFLFQYENDKSHKGYNSRYLSKELRAVLVNDQKSIKKSKETNRVLYTGKTVIADFLRHLRNSFAHCYIQSNNSKSLFVLYDKDRSGKCSMYGVVNKAVLYNLIREINKTRNSSKTCKSNEKE